MNRINQFIRPISLADCRLPLMDFMASMLRLHLYFARNMLHGHGGASGKRPRYVPVRTWVVQVGDTCFSPDPETVCGLDGPCASHVVTSIYVPRMTHISSCILHILLATSD